MGEFAAYLNYRGVPVEGSTVQAGMLNDVIVAPSAVRTDRRCFPYRAFICHTGGRPKSGDLVIELPDDHHASPVESNYFRNGGATLFSWEPYPRIPESVFSFVNRVAHQKDLLTNGYMHQ